MTLTRATPVLRIGTRGSALALEQTRRVRALLVHADPELRTEEHIIYTRGDRDTQSSLPEIGEKGVFTDELERALLAGEIDIAVHSLKDLPINDRTGVTLAAICHREDPRDALVARESTRLADLRPGAVVGTSSPRREAQMRALRPDVVVRPVRGNVPTRCRKVREGEYEAVVLAWAGLRRLKLDAQATEIFDPDTFLSAPGQGALAVQCRADDAATRALLARIDDASVRACTTAERAFLAALGGGCSLPVAALAEPVAGGLRLRGLVISQDGTRRIRVERTGALEDAEAVGHALGEEALAQGAGELLP